MEIAKVCWSILRRLIFANATSVLHIPRVCVGPARASFAAVVAVSFINGAYTRAFILWYAYLSCRLPSGKMRKSLCSHNSTTLLLTQLKWNKFGIDCNWAALGQRNIIWTESWVLHIKILENVLAQMRMAWHTQLSIAHAPPLIPNRITLTAGIQVSIMCRIPPNTEIMSIEMPLRSDATKSSARRTKRRRTNKKSSLPMLFRLVRIRQIETGSTNRLK